MNIKDLPHGSYTVVPPQGNQQQGNFLGDVGNALGTYASGVGQQYMGAAQDIMQNWQKSKDNPNNPIVGAETGIRTLGDVAGAAFAPISQGVSQGIVNPIADFISNNPDVQKFAMGSAGDKVTEIQKKFADLQAKHPNATKDLASLYNIVALMAAQHIASAGNEAVGNATDAFKGSSPTEGTPPPPGASTTGIPEATTMPPETVNPSQSSPISVSGIGDKLTHIDPATEEALKQTNPDIVQQYLVPA